MDIEYGTSVVDRNDKSLGTVDYIVLDSWSGEQLSSLDHGWDVGAALRLPLFNGFLTRYQVNEAT